MTASKRRPSTLPGLCVDALPEDLRSLLRYVAWRYEWRSGNNRRPGKWTKVPVNPHTGGNGSSTDPAT